MTATEIQTAAAIIQAAALVFFFSVVCDARRRRQLAEQERRDAIIKALFVEWSVSPPQARTPMEAQGVYSPRQIDFFNTRVKKIGERWTYPFRRVGERAEWIARLIHRLDPRR